MRGIRARYRLELLREIVTKKAIVNVRSIDNVYFAWSMVAALWSIMVQLNTMSTEWRHTIHTLYDCAKFRRYRVSGNVEGHYEI